MYGVDPRIGRLQLAIGKCVCITEARKPGDCFATFRPVFLNMSGLVPWQGGSCSALRQNLDIQIANIETATREQDRVIARSELLPHASFEADDSVNRHNLRALLGIQIPIPIVPHNIGPYQAVQVGPTFAVPVFDLTLIRQYQASGHRLLASRDDQQTVREETVLLTVSEYMAHLRALANITAAESRVALAARLAQQADDLLKDGVASKIDVSRAQVKLREDQQSLIDALLDAEHYCLCA